MQLKQQGPVGYLVRGTGPRLLIRSGIHGDEYGVVAVLRELVGKFEDRLPDFVFIPEVSPTAVRRRKRTNIDGVDLNRDFKTSSGDPEVVANMAIVSQFKFDLGFEFHEDPGAGGFYIYDTGVLPKNVLANLRGKVLAAGFDLYDGVDDIDDPVLARKIDNGYRSMPVAEIDSESGMFEVWAIKNRLVRRGLTVEIPGRLPLARKRVLVGVVFEELVFKLLVE